MGDHWTGRPVVSEQGTNSRIHWQPQARRGGEPDPTSCQGQQGLGPEKTRETSCSLGSRSFQETKLHHRWRSYTGVKSRNKSELGTTATQLKTRLNPLAWIKREFLESRSRYQVNLVRAVKANECSPSPAQDSYICVCLAWGVVWSSLARWLAVQGVPVFVQLTMNLVKA